MKPLSLKNQTFNSLTGIERVGSHPRNKRAMWKFSCACGNTKTLEGSAVPTERLRT